MARTIGKCLKAIYSSDYNKFEVVVVDDGSKDNSVEIIRTFPCKLVVLGRNHKESKARNTGFLNSNGEILFFTDADCLLNKDTLSKINNSMTSTNPDIITGGTYTRLPHDKDFFSTFQSVLINYSETKNCSNPDYLATHAMVIDAQTFKTNGMFNENILLLEDVMFSHRMKKNGFRLVMDPAIQLQHIFNFSFMKSLRNAIKKSRHWIIYSIKNKDLLADSGTASNELKVNVISYFLSLILVFLWVFSGKTSFLFPVPVIFLVNCYISRSLIRAFYKTKGLLFSLQAFLYYTLLYPFAVGIGSALGLINFVFKKVEI